MYTKGKWVTSKSLTGEHYLGANDDYIGLIDRHFNAQLIVSAVNACISINKDNPRAVAEGLEELYKAGLEYMIGRDMYDPAYQTMIKALNKIEARIGGK